MTPVYPFTAIVGQEDLRLALCLVAVEPRLGGLLALGDRGTGKSTAVRALADVLPPIQVVAGCPYQCAPSGGHACVEGCPRAAGQNARQAIAMPVPVVDLPLGATEDRVVGALDLEYALVKGERRFEPGLLARANRGFLYIDEVNLLEDHLVDVLLDVAASGENVVEREGISVRHPARFVLVGSGNPEEGELRPQLMDRFGLMVVVATPTGVQDRIEIVRRRDAYEQDPIAFREKWAGETQRLSRRLHAARERLSSVAVDEAILEKVAAFCIALGTEGLRGELTLMRAARALASFEGADAVALDHVRRTAVMASAHRLRRNPLDESDAGVRVQRVIGEILGGERIGAPS